MRSLVLCYAPADDKTALELSRFIEANLDIEVCRGECVVRPGFDLIDAAERALSADAALVMISPASVPRTWRREIWEPVFFATPEEFGTRLAFIQLGDCQFPPLLRRRRFFDFRGDFLAGAREVKRWLLAPVEVRSGGLPSPAVEVMRGRIADWPGALSDIEVSLAREFAKACGADFEAGFEIDCQYRSRAGLLGDIAGVLGLRLEGTAAQNRDALVREALAHRYLFVLVNSRPEDRDFLTLGGRTSAIFADDGDRAAPDASQIQTAFFTAPRDEALCLKLLGAASCRTAALLEVDVEAGLRLSWAVVTVLQSAGRFAEAIEGLETMESAALRHGQDRALAKIQWEKSWLTGLGDGILPTAAPNMAQLTFEFA